MKRKAISSDMRLEVYDKYDGHCAYCGVKLELKDMQVDHLISVYRASFDEELNEDYINSFENYMPSCRMCNYYKRARGLKSFRRDIEKICKQLEKSFDYRLAKRYGLVSETPHSVKFYFEEFEDEK